MRAKRIRSAMKTLFRLDDRIEAHVFTAFMALCLLQTLRAIAREHAPGLTPRQIIDKFRMVKMVDVVMPTTEVPRRLQIVFVIEDEASVCERELTVFTSDAMGAAVWLMVGLPEFGKGTVVEDARERSEDSAVCDDEDGVRLALEREDDLVEKTAQAILDGCERLTSVARQFGLAYAACVDVDFDDAALDAHLAVPVRFAVPDEENVYSCVLYHPTGLSISNDLQEDKHA